MKIVKATLKREDEEGYKVKFGLGSGKKRRRVTLPTVGVFATREQAKEEYRKAKAKFARKEWMFPADRQTVTVGTLFEARLKYIATKKACTPKHIRMAEHTYELFGQKILARDSSIDLLTHSHFEEYFELRRSQGKSIQTARKELKQIIAAMNYAGNIPGLESWTPPRNPADLEPNEPEEKRPITRQEQALILDECRRRQWIHLEHLIIMGIHTGLRVSEIFRIDRADIHDEPKPGCPHGWFIARTRKTAKFLLTGKTKNREVRMSRTVRRIMDERRADWDPTLTAEMPTSGPLFPEFNYIPQLKQVCKAAGVVYGPPPTGITFHSTRHAFVTRERERNTRWDLIQKMTGQKNLGVTRGYAHVDPLEVADAMAHLDDEEE